MGGGVAGEAFEAAGDIDEFLDLRLGLVLLGKFRDGVQRLLQGHLEVAGRYHLGDARGFGKGYAHGAAHVLEHGLGLHLAEGGYLRDLVLAVLLRDIVQHFEAPVFAEVHVDIRHADAFDVEEAFEEELVGQRVYGGDAQRPGHDGTCGRTSARADRDVVPFRPVDIVLHDEEVAGEAHVVDDLEFHFKAFPVFLLVQSISVGVPFKALVEAGSCHAAELGLEGHAFGQFVDGEMVGRSLELYLELAALLGDLDRVGHGLVGDSDEACAHLFFALEIEVLGVEAEALHVVYLGLGLDAEQDVVGLHVIGVQVVAVVGGHEGELGGVCDFQYLLVDESLFRQGVGLHFEVEAFREQGRVLLGEHDGIIKGAAARDELVLAHEGARYLTGHAGGKGDEAVGMAVEHLLVDARLVVEAFQPAPAYKMQEVLIAHGILRQKDEVMAHTGEIGGLVGVVTGDVDFTADDRRHARVLAGRIEVGRAEKAAMVSDGNTGHAQVLGFFCGIGDTDGAVEQAEFSVAVQVDEIRHKDSSLSAGK